MSIYAKNNGTWVPVGPAITVSAEGAPGAPELVDKDGNPDTSGGSVIYYRPAPQGAAGPNLAHGASISPADGATVTVDQDNLEVFVSGTTPFTDYVVSVYGVNEAGRGDIAKTDAFQLNYNKASGGTPKTGNIDPEYPGADIVDDYNNTGQKWAVHTFDSNGNFDVISAPGSFPFRTLLVGGGGGGGFAGGNSPGAGDCAGGGGGGGGFLADDSANLTEQSHTITIGNGGGSDVKGGNTTAFGLTAIGGGAGRDGRNPGGGGSGGSGGGGANNGGGGAGTAGQGHNGGYGSGDISGSGGGAGGNGPGTSTSPGPAKSWDISGSPVQYAGGGAGKARTGFGGHGAHGTGPGGGGGGATGTGWGGSGGSKGIVIIAYQIGTSTTREIQQAQAETAARQAG